MTLRLPFHSVADACSCSFSSYFVKDKTKNYVLPLESPSEEQNYVLIMLCNLMLLFMFSYKYVFIYLIIMKTTLIQLSFSFVYGKRRCCSAADFPLHLLAIPFHVTVIHCCHQVMICFYLFVRSVYGTDHDDDDNVKLWNCYRNTMTMTT